MPKMHNKIFYSGPMPFGMNVIVGNQDHGRTRKAFIKNIHISNMANKDVGNNSIGSASKVLFGIETNDKVADFPCFLYQTEALVDGASERTVAVKDLSIYGSNDGESKWACFNGSSNPRNRHLGTSKFQSHNPGVLMIDPRPKEYQFEWDFSKESDKVGWETPTGTALGTGDGYIKIQSSVGGRIDVSSKIAEILAANPSKKLRYATVEIIVKPENSTSTTAFQVGLKSSTDHASSFRMVALSTGSNAIVYGNSSYYSYIYNARVFGRSYTLPENGTHFGIYHSGPTYLRVSAVRMCLVFQEQLEVEPLFVSDKVRMPFPNVNTPNLATSMKSPVHITFPPSGQCSNRINNTGFTSTYLPEVEIQFSADAGKTWTQWIDMEDVDAKLIALSKFPKSCNLYYRWRILGINYGPNPNINSVDYFTIGRRALSTDIKVPMLGPIGWRHAITNTYMYNYYMMQLGTVDVNRGLDGSHYTYNVRTAKYFGSRTGTDIFSIEVERNAEEQDLSYDVNIPLELHQQFYMAYFANLGTQIAAVAKYHKLFYPCQVVPYSADPYSYTMSHVPNVVITGYEVEE